MATRSIMVDKRCVSKYDVAAGVTSMATIKATPTSHPLHFKQQFKEMFILRPVDNEQFALFDLRHIVRVG